MLEQMRNRLEGARTFEAAIDTLLRDVIALHGAEFGNVQLPIGTNFVIVAQQGLSAAFLKAFRTVDKDQGCACGRVIRLGIPVMVADVNKDKEYVKFRADAKAAGYRAVQSSPLQTRDGAMIGIVSTLFANVHEPSPIEMETLRRYSGVASEYLRQLLGDEKLTHRAVKMNRALYAGLV